MGSIGRQRQNAAAAARAAHAALAAAACLAALAGCSAPLPTNPAPATHHAAAHSTSIPTPASSTGTPYADEFQYLPPADTILGTGRLMDVGGHATGDVTVSVAPDLRFQIAIAGFATTVGPGLTVALSVDRFGATAGAPTVPAVDDAVGQVTGTSGDQLLPFPSTGRRDRGDLSYYNSVELVSDGVVYAAAPIAWTVPDFFPGLTLTDSGPATDARGIVTDYDGAPASYQVWGNDNSEAVAERFGITQNQLFYLNPQLWRGDTTLLRDTRLNLSVTYR